MRRTHVCVYVALYMRYTAAAGGAAQAVSCEQGFGTAAALDNPQQVKRGP